MPTLRHIYLCPLIWRSVLLCLSSDGIFKELLNAFQEVRLCPRRLSPHPKCSFIRKLLSDTPQLAPVVNGGAAAAAADADLLAQRDELDQRSRSGTWKPERTFGPGLSVGERMMGVSANLLKVVVFDGRVGGGGDDGRVEALIALESKCGRLRNKRLRRQGAAKGIRCLRRFSLSIPSHFHPKASSDEIHPESATLRWMVSSQRHPRNTDGSHLHQPACGRAHVSLTHPLFNL